MKKNLKKRIYTSFFLLILSICSILLNEWLFIFCLFTVLFVCYLEWREINKNYFKKKKENIISSYTLVKICGFCYILFVFFSAIVIRGTTLEQAFFFTFIIFICICSDIGGYLFGKIFSGPKLTKISPNKTISGSVGSFVLSLLPILLINIENFYSINLPLNNKNIFICLLISLVCQLGDLFISYFKRLNKVKDTGKILPGHGGLLDRIDGVIFVIPFIFVLKFTNLF